MQIFHWEQLLNPSIIWVLIPITAIVCGGFAGIVKLIINHRERMALIEQGIHPDYPPEEDAKAAPKGHAETTYRS